MDQRHDQILWKAEVPDWGSSPIPAVRDEDGPHLDGSMGKVFDSDIACMDKYFKQILRSEHFSSHKMVDEKKAAEIEFGVV
jgi:hypothetical protein